MTANAAPRSRAIWLMVAAVLALGLAAIAGWLAASLSSGPAALSDTDRGAIETVVREYILTHPEILPEAMENLQQRENAKQLAGIRDQVEAPFAGAILGNPKGSVTLVEFSDYACGYCRRSVPDVEALLKSHPDLRIVMRELPILSEESAAAAKMALAAAEQGKYAAFHNTMFAAGPPSAQSIAAAARAAGLDMAKAQAAIASPRVDAEINGNLEMARQLGFSGTPSWVVGDQLISGAVGVESLAEAIADSRS